MLKVSINKPLLYGVLFSGAINIAVLDLIYKQNQMSPLPEDNQKEELMIDFLSDEPNQFIDTVKDNQINELEEDTEYFSDQTTQKDSSFDGDREGILPQSEIKDIQSQAKRDANQNTLPAQFSPPLKEQIATKNEQKKESTDEKKIEVLQELEGDEPEKKSEKDIKKDEAQKKKKFLKKELKKIQNMDMSLSSPLSVEDDLFPLPMLSIGDHTSSMNGLDSFAAKGNPLGEYVKQLRDKIGLLFHKMIIFQYKTSYILESTALVYFEINPLGLLEKLEIKESTGDPLFSRYCESIIRQASPFEPLPENISPYLTKGGNLDMNVYFGNNVRERSKDD